MTLVHRVEETRAFLDSLGETSKQSPLMMISLNFRDQILSFLFFLSDSLESSLKIFLFQIYQIFFPLPLGNSKLPGMKDQLFPPSVLSLSYFVDLGYLRSWGGVKFTHCDLFSGNTSSSLAHNNSEASTMLSSWFKGAQWGALEGTKENVFIFKTLHCIAF